MRPDGTNSTWPVIGPREERRQKGGEKPLLHLFCKQYIYSAACIWIFFFCVRSICLHNVGIVIVLSHLILKLRWVLGFHLQVG